MPRLSRALKPWELAARRRNARKSTGPRTREGKRRAALNSLKWPLCPREVEEHLAARGESPGEFRRLYRDLIALLRPSDAGLERLVGQLAVEFGEKLALLRARSPAADAKLRRLEIDERIAVTLARWVAELLVRSTSWYRHLTSTLGEFISCPGELRRRIENRLAAFGGATIYRISAQNTNIFRMNKLADLEQKTNLMLISVALSMRYTRFRASLAKKTVDCPIPDSKRLFPGTGPV